ncbi:hypothetical protein Pta02_27980 [Planobispora takensis]|uniref:Uncharacterized protein n=1 Tax=Planobispora takensis TaxID=1367882 RepID=A0A8J3WSX4_9ACTN|nr:hypothetical protein Pta02_27980 [Planobispora takensis]
MSTLSFPVVPTTDMFWNDPTVTVAPAAWAGLVIRAAPAVAAEAAIVRIMMLRRIRDMREVLVWTWVSRTDFM